MPMCPHRVKALGTDPNPGDLGEEEDQEREREEKIVGDEEVPISGVEDCWMAWSSSSQ